MTDRLIRSTTALAVLMVAGVAAVISYYAYELVASHGERASPRDIPEHAHGCGSDAITKDTSNRS